jgi:Flp pilus assembly protein TadD/cell division protein FtsN
MDRNFKSRSLLNRPAPILALLVPAAFAGVIFAGFDAAAAPPRTQAHAAKAQAALQAGQADKAIIHAEAAVASDPLNARYRAMLGAAYMGAGRFLAAATSFEDALDLGQEDARTVLSYALAKTAIGDARVAIAALDDARGQLNAADYGLALALAGQAERGVQVLIHAVRNEEPTSKLRQNLAYAYALAGNWRAARVMAAEDVPAGEVDARIVAWASHAAPEHFQQRVASLLKVRPVYDNGQPASLALANFLSDSPANAPVFAADETAPAAVAKPEQPRQSEALAYGLEDVPGGSAIERVDPTPTMMASASASAPAPVAAPVTVTGAIRFVSRPVVQELPAAAVSRPAPAPQRRMAATVAASTPALASAPAVRQVASDKSAGTHLVQLGSYDNKVEAERGWNALKAKFPQLKDHDVVITEALVNGRSFFRVAVAGFGPQSAKSMCGTLKSAGRGCFAYAASNPPAGAVDKGVRLAARTQ